MKYQFGYTSGWVCEISPNYDQMTQQPTQNILWVWEEGWLRSGGGLCRTLKLAKWLSVTSSKTDGKLGGLGTRLENCINVEVKIVLARKFIFVAGP